MMDEEGPSDTDIERNGIKGGPYGTNAVDDFPPTPPQKTAFEVDVASTSPLPVNIKRKNKKNHNHNNYYKKDPDSGDHFLQKIDSIVYLSYFCNVLAVNLPIILLPLAASEGAAMKSAGDVNGSPSVATIVASVTSVTTLGGALGKFLSGFVCQRWGPYQCSKIYLLGVALCSGLFSVSTTPTMWGWACAGMEFCSSIQWTSLVIMLSSYYSKSSPAKLAAGLTAMGISSPTGAIVAKTVGAALASRVHWRMVARLGCLVAMAGSYVISTAPIQPFQQDSMDLLHKKYTARPMGAWITRGVVGGAAKVLLTSKLFWMLSLAHSMAFVVRGIDRILGIFFSDMTGLPPALTGGLTLSTTLGLLYGLISASKTFPNLSIDGQTKMLRKRYIFNVVGTLGLAAIAAAVARDPTATAFPSSSSASIAKTIGVLGALTIFSGFMSFNVAYQFFQFPTMVAKSFTDHKEVCLSWMDGIGYLFAAPVFAVTAEVVPNYGWLPVWGMLSGLFACAGILMMHALPPILAKEKELTKAAEDQDDDSYQNHHHQ